MPTGFLDGGVGIFVQDQNYFPGATPTTIVQNRNFSITGNTVTDPACKGIWVQDVGRSRSTSARRSAATRLTGAGVYDCQDQTAGALTVGTANTWTSNVGSAQQPVRPV